MTSLFRHLASAAVDRASATYPLSLDDWASFFSYNGLGYPVVNQTLGGQAKQEAIAGDFGGLVRGAYGSNGVVFACMLCRQLLFSEARFQFRQRRDGRPGDLFGSPALSPLERPWPNATTGDLLTRAIQDHDLAGNFFAARRPGNQIRRLRPDWTWIVLGSRKDPDNPGWDVDSEVLGYAYQPGGPAGARDVELYERDQVAHFATIPDPDASYRGMSWLTPIVREIMGDKAMRDHKLAFFENGGTNNMVVKVTDPNVSPDEFEEFVSKYRRQYEGWRNAYRTVFLAGGADVTVVGSTLEQMTFKEVQGAGETRIAAAAGVPPVIVGLSEGLAAATYSNYGQARRRFADGTMRPLWRNIAGSLATIIDVPAAAELWYDDRDIPFLQEDVKDAAEVQSRQAETIAKLVKEGWTPESCVDAVVAGDFRRLKHSGLISVQLQPPGSQNVGLNGGGTPLALPAPADADD